MYGLSKQEMEPLGAELTKACVGPDNEIIPISPLFAKYLAGGVRASDRACIAGLDEALAIAKMPRASRRQLIQDVKSMGPAPEPEDRETEEAFNNFLNFLQGLEK